MFTLGSNSIFTFLLLYLGKVSLCKFFFQEYTLRRKWVFNELFDFEVPIYFLRWKNRIEI